LTSALLILMALNPQPSLRDIVAGPGFVACAAVLLAAVLPLIHFAAAVMVSHGLAMNLMVPFKNMFGMLANTAAPMIIGAWLALALVGRWRPLPTWTDRLGCAVGAFWVLLYGYIELYSIGALPVLVRWAG
jgi:hypothetical protein